MKSRFFIDTLKKEQEEALFNFVCKRDVFVNLPTGFGKSLIYQMAPMVVKELGLCINPIIMSSDDSVGSHKTHELRGPHAASTRRSQKNVHTRGVHE